MKAKALVTYGWNRVSYNIVRSLGKEGVDVVVGDTHTLAMSRFTKYRGGYFRYPSFYIDPEGFISTIIDEAEKRKASIYLPVHEETFIASKYKNRFEAAGLKLPVSNFSLLSRLHKKEKLFDTCTELGIPTPRITKIADLKELEPALTAYEFPVVVKSDQTNSAKGVNYIHSRTNAVSEYMNVAKRSSKLPFLQEYVRGTGYGVSLLMNHGEVRAKFTHKRLREKTYTGGTSTVRVSTRNPLMEDYAITLLSKLKFHGVAMVEFKYDEKTNKAYIIDVNTRFWGSLALAIRSGVNFPLMLYTMAQNGDVAPVLEYKEGIRVKWILGEALAFLSEVAHTRKIYASLKHCFSQKADGYDDFYWDDPLPFAFESLYYFNKFLVTKSVNPTTEAMLDIDRI